MHQLISEENWSTPARALMYSCSVLHDDVPPDSNEVREPTEPHYLACRRDHVRANTIRLLNRDNRHL